MKNFVLQCYELRVSGYEFKKKIVRQCEEQRVKSNEK